MAKSTSITKPAPARKSARNATPSKSGTAKSKAGSTKVAVERRTDDRRSASVAAVPPQLERRQKVNRRRQIDPTTCERDYTDSEVEFMNALELYKRKNGRMFPTCSEVLEVIRGLGYVKSTSNLPLNEINLESRSQIESESEFGFATRSVQLTEELKSIC